MESLDKLKGGEILRIFFKEGYMRPTTGQRFKFLGLSGKPENMTKKDGYFVDGFVIMAEPIDLDGAEVIPTETMKPLPQMLFPHTIERLETIDEQPDQISKEEESP